MPTYVYRCRDCGHEFEKVQRMSDNPLTQCPKCKGKIGRVPCAVGITFKGSGFHVNDYPSSKSATAAPAKKEETKAGTAATSAS
ncbi:MAG: FmdB family zinc ribbon protein [Armatimonadota bacterium]|nr:FmdB family transcriptional regulator [bacterium]